MHIDYGPVSAVFMGLLTIVAFMFKMELHDIKTRITRIENAFIKAGAAALNQKEDD